MSVEITAVYQGQLHCEATHGPSGNKLVTDAPTDNGGRGAAFSPSDLVATALGTCVMTIMGLVADRHELDLSGTTIRVEKEMASTPVRRIASLKTQVTFPSGLEMQPEMRDRLIAAARKCPVHQSLHPDIDAPIDFVDLD
ncbi:OsmC family protein [Rhodopirellula bahusiensis]|uniref:Osmotically inducible protein OsmC n=1 Tax=Rhodopirellula bahusiensis TaxID=2014065 RepID=A0A2G1W4X0_9BACT|nr:OsmC family protein [Rhodopirellula bahusiensis]PHQ34094.1 osmotically inducible protein OsmC [Rhodopirellula bahusiensis]